MEVDVADIDWDRIDTCSFASYSMDHYLMEVWTIHPAKAKNDTSLAHFII